ncbi:MAG TPA: hypothetical protein DCO75_11665 [Fibrobacteres bacterium]|nr:hypothetical protein [Fibrobacterota bacterium]
MFFSFPQKILVLILLNLMFFSFCNKKYNQLPCSTILELTGNASVNIPGHKSKNAATGMPVTIGSEICVGPASEITVGLNNTKWLKAPENACFSITAISRPGTGLYSAVKLINGKIFCIFPLAIIIDSFSLPINIRSADSGTLMLICHEKNTHVAVLKTIGGSAEVYISDSMVADVPPCSKIMIADNGKVSKALALHENDLDEIKTIAGKTSDDSTTGNIDCFKTGAAQQAMAPTWEKAPVGECVAGVEFTDTLKAITPQGLPVVYKLIEAPQAMTIDSVSGILHFFPHKTTVYPIKKILKYWSILSISMAYNLTVLPAIHKRIMTGHNAVVTVPAIAVPGDTVLKNASHCAPETSSLSLKMPDTAAMNSIITAACIVNGKGTFGDFSWDFEGTNSYKIKSDKPVQTYTYMKKGAYTVSCIASNSHDETFICKHDIVVIDKTISVNAGGPYKAHVNKPVSINGSFKMSANKVISCSWDFDGDGVFDTILKVNAKVIHNYMKSGTIHAIFKVTDNDKKEWADTAQVSVVNTPPVAHAGKDILSQKGRRIKLKGYGEDSDDGIVLYEWDFDGNGVYDWSGPISKEVKHVFNEYSKAVFRVTDHNGSTSTDTVSIVICPDDMVSVEPCPFCIDKYEWPNKKGQIPDRQMTREEAIKKCNEAGKHLCTGNEWERACAGEDKINFPRSNAPATQNCNAIGNKEFTNKIAPSGSFTDCKSPSGAFDMNGNVAEWTSDAATDKENAYVYGGSWHNNIADAGCSSKLTLDKNTGYFYVGFRCCK